MEIDINEALKFATLKKQSAVKSFLKKNKNKDNEKLLWQKIFTTNDITFIFNILKYQSSTDIADYFNDLPDSSKVLINPAIEKVIHCLLHDKPIDIKVIDDFILNQELVAASNLMKIKLDFENNSLDKFELSKRASEYIYSLMANSIFAKKEYPLILKDWIYAKESRLLIFKEVLENTYKEEVKHMWSDGLKSKLSTVLENELALILKGKISLNTNDIKDIKDSKVNKNKIM